MSHHTAVIELLTAVSSVMKKWGDRWYLFGAQAVMLWGRPRMSADVDITAQLIPEDAPGFIQSMKQAGFDLRVKDAEGFVKRTRVLPFLHVPTQLPLDVVLAGPGLEEQFLERALHVELGETAVPVISPEDLIVTKILASRPKDLEDVRGILRERHATLDMERVRATLDLLEQALAQSDLRPVLEAELAALGD